MPGGREGQGEQFVVGTPVSESPSIWYSSMTSRRGPRPWSSAAALGFERGDDHTGVGPFVDIARADAHVPAGGAPFGELVVGQRTGGHGENGVALERGVEQLEDVRLCPRRSARGRRHRGPRAGRRRLRPARDRGCGGWLRGFSWDPAARGLHRRSRHGGNVSRAGSGFNAIRDLSTRKIEDGPTPRDDDGSHDNERDYDGDFSGPEGELSSCVPDPVWYDCGI